MVDAVNLLGSHHPAGKTDVKSNKSCNRDPCRMVVEKARVDRHSNWGIREVFFAELDFVLSVQR